MPANASVTTQRQFMQHYFDKNTYSVGQSMVCFINSGACYIDGNNSFLSFETTLTLPGTFLESADTAFTSFGHHNCAANLIKSITLYSRAGLQLEHITEVGRIASITGAYDTTREWVETTGTVAGFDWVSSEWKDNDVSKSFRFRIPLRLHNQVGISARQVRVVSETVG